MVKRISSFNNAINDSNYMKKLYAKAKEILGNNDNIKLNDLKNKPLFSALKNNKEVQERINTIASFDENNKNVSKSELLTLLMFSDGVFNNKTKKFELDGNYKLTDKNGKYNPNSALTKAKVTSEEPESDWTMFDVYLAIDANESCKESLKYGVSED